MRNSPPKWPKTAPPRPEPIPTRRMNGPAGAQRPGRSAFFPLLSNSRLLKGFVMNTAATRRKQGEIARLLERAAHFNRLAKQCPEAVSANYYRSKDRLLILALARAPEQFLVDSVADGGVLFGLTHRPSGRQVHLYIDRLPAEAVALVRRLPGPSPSSVVRRISSYYRSPNGSQPTVTCERRMP